MVGTTSGLGGFMSGASIRFSKYKGGTGGADAWRDQLAQSYQKGSGRDARPRTTGLELPKVNSIHTGTVVCTRDFGAFIQLGDGTVYKDGLMHVTHMGPERVEAPEDVGLKVGTSVKVKVMEVKENDMKYSLDMRYVDQVDGKDLDQYQTKGRLPNNRWNGGNVKAAAEVAKKPSALAQLSGSLAPEESVSSSTKRQKLNQPLPSEDGDTSEDSDEREEIREKLKKARKKLEKIKKKAEKAKKKLQKQASKKSKKDKSSSSDD